MSVKAVYISNLMYVLTFKSDLIDHTIGNGLHMAQNNPITNKFFILNTRPKFKFLSYFRLLICFQTQTVIKWHLGYQIIVKT